jgi:hypothetical protein
VLSRASTLAAIRNALPHSLLEDRALVLARLAYPIAIDDDRRVAAIRNRERPTWDDYAQLAAARETVARERFEKPFIALMHELHGVREVHHEDPTMPPPLDGWHSRDIEVDSHAVDAHAVDAMWRDLATRYGVTGRMRIVGAGQLSAPKYSSELITASSGAENSSELITGLSGANNSSELITASRDVRPRTFIVEPGGEVIVVLPATFDTPAARFAVLHEFGHALVGLLSTTGVPRVVDEAVASLIARRMEQPDTSCYSALAKAARERRVQVARALDAIERGTSTARPTERPPWALWHDPGAQAAYIEAEAIADTLDDTDLRAALKMRR